MTILISKNSVPLEFKSGLGTGEKSFDCLICSKTFLHKHQLYVCTQHDELRFECSKCGWLFVDEKSTESHRKRCKSRLTECYMYGYETFIKRDLDMHMKAMHNGKKQFQCGIGQKKFLHRGHLNHHQVIHHDQFPYQCSKCSRAFALEAEMISHEKFCRCRQYQCYLCEAFVQSRQQIIRERDVPAKNHLFANCAWHVSDTKTVQIGIHSAASQRRRKQLTPSLLSAAHVRDRILFDIFIF